MFIFRKFHLFLILISIFIFANYIFAQTIKEQPGTSNKIAVINSDFFYYDNKGIKEILEVKRKIVKELVPQKNEILLLVEKILKLEDEIKVLSARCIGKVECSPELIGLTDKDKEHDELKCKIKSKIEESNMLFEKRSAELTFEINKEISKALRQFSENKKILIILQTSKGGNYCFDCEDITEEFIKFYNENFSRAKS